jgi:DNA-binding transcriptional regulator YhcF (GntR family)
MNNSTAKTVHSQYTNVATDTRPPFLLIEEAVIDDYHLHPLAGWLYVVIVRHINRKQNDAFPSVTRLAKLANMSKASVMRYTKVLEAAGLISVTREKDADGENQVNHYKLLTATRVVSDSNQGSATQQLPVVAESNHNQMNKNQKKEPKEKEKEAPLVESVPVAELTPAEMKEQGAILFQEVLNKMNGNMGITRKTDAQIAEEFERSYAKHPNQRRS